MKKTIKLIGDFLHTDDCCVKCRDSGCVTVYGFNKPMIPGKKL